MSTATLRRPPADRICLEAADLARSAAEEVAGPDRVGRHVDALPEEDRVLTHLFECLDPAYRGWCWAVTVARAARSRAATVDEVALLPGEDALRPPPWLPWSERLQPGDLGVGDLLPTDEDDPRLVPAFLSTDEGPGDDAQGVDVTFELGLGRARVLSFEGRVEAVERWYHGGSGPEAPIARAAPAQCATCGFYVPLAGSLRQAFGVCANEYAPDDGRVVAVDHGCGAHSEAVVVPSPVVTAAPLLDEFRYDVIELAPPGHHLTGSVSDGDTGEPLGHS